MVTEEFDKLVLCLGGLSAMSRALAKKGFPVSHTSIRRWYSSKNLYPKPDLLKVCNEIAKENGLKIKLK